MSHDPRMNPQEGDTLRRWNTHFRVTRVSQGCVFTEPRISEKGWVGILYFREFFAGTEVDSNVR